MLTIKRALLATGYAFRYSPKANYAERIASTMDIRLVLSRWRTAERLTNRPPKLRVITIVVSRYLVSVLVCTTYLHIFARASVATSQQKVDYSFAASKRQPSCFA